jgi:hypothetical protein
MYILALARVRAEPKARAIVKLLYCHSVLMILDGGDTWCWELIPLIVCSQARQLEQECSKLRGIMSPFSETMDWMTSSKFPGCVQQAWHPFLQLDPRNCPCSLGP